MTTATPGMVLSCHFTVMNVCPSANRPQSGVESGEGSMAIAFVHQYLKEADREPEGAPS